ncbi:hypothetical protein PS898_03125 [Pseudomonas fluorescens]|nr:hypothetical protein PS898_03125 [Pseudomonas fluorescens]
MTLRPKLSYLAHCVNQRIFQYLSVPKIIGMVLEEHGIQSNAYEFKTGSIYPERIYCVQYDESDLHFIQRLCEAGGIHYHFQHSATAQKLVCIAQGLDERCDLAVHVLLSASPHVPT